MHRAKRHPSCVGCKDKDEGNKDIQINILKSIQEDNDRWVHRDYDIEEKGKHAINGKNHSSKT